MSIFSQALDSIHIESNNTEELNCALAAIRKLSYPETSQLEVYLEYDAVKLLCIATMDAIMHGPYADTLHKFPNTVWAVMEVAEALKVKRTYTQMEVLDRTYESAVKHIVSILELLYKYSVFDTKTIKEAVEMADNKYGQNGTFMEALEYSIQDLTKVTEVQERGNTEVIQHIDPSPYTSADQDVDLLDQAVKVKYKLTKQEYIARVLGYKE